MIFLCANESYSCLPDLGGPSWIIELLFGKLKSLEKDQSKGGFTSLILDAARCVGKVDDEIVSAADVKSGQKSRWDQHCFPREESTWVV